ARRAGEPGPGGAAGADPRDRAPRARDRPSRRQARAHLQPWSRHHAGRPRRSGERAGRRGPERLMAVTPARGVAAPLGIIALNLGGPGSLDDVQPFLRRLFGDPDVIQLGLARPFQPLLAWAIARSRGPKSRAAYAQIGGKSPILDETTAQAKAVAAE